MGAVRLHGPREGVRIQIDGVVLRRDERQDLLRGLDERVVAVAVSQQTRGLPHHRFGAVVVGGRGGGEEVGRRRAAGPPSSPVRVPQRRRAPAASRAARGSQRARSMDGDPVTGTQLRAAVAAVDKTIKSVHDEAKPPAQALFSALGALALKS